MLVIGVLVIGDWLLVGKFLRLYSIGVDISQWVLGSVSTRTHTPTSTHRAFMHSRVRHVPFYNYRHSYAHSAYIHSVCS